MNETRTAYVETAAVARDLVRSPEVGAHWERPSAMDGVTVGGAAAHLVGSGIDAVLTSLTEPEPPGDRELGPARFFSGQSLDLDHEGHRQIRERAATGSERGHESLVLGAEAGVAELERRLEEEPEGRRVVVLGRFHMRLDDFLVTRLVELVVHLDDLASSLALPTPEVSPVAVDRVVVCLTGVARRRVGDLAVVRALARGQRAEVGVFPIF